MTDDLGTCGCGDPADKYSSGIPECYNCNRWRKLQRPAALHWEKVAAEFLSNVDMYDWMYYFTECGLTREQAVTMIEAAVKVRDHSKATAKMPPHLAAREQASSE